MDMFTLTNMSTSIPTPKSSELEEPEECRRIRAWFTPGSYSRTANKESWFSGALISVPESPLKYSALKYAPSGFVDVPVLHFNSGGILVWSPGLEVTFSGDQLVMLVQWPAIKEPTGDYPLNLLLFTRTSDKTSPERRIYDEPKGMDLGDGERQIVI